MSASGASVELTIYRKGSFGSSTVAAPDTISDTELAAQLLPRRFATEHFTYGKDKYWRGGDMVNHIVKVAIPIFNAAFPGCQAIFAFDNASNHALMQLMHFESKHEPQSGR